MPAEIILRKIEKTRIRGFGKGVEAPDVKEFIRQHVEDKWGKMLDEVQKLQDKVEALETQLAMEMVDYIRNEKLAEFKDWLPKYKEQKAYIKTLKNQTLPVNTGMDLDLKVERF
jgi:cell division septum initiation protein DivIVA